MTYDDETIKTYLRQIDISEVTSGEASFLETVLYNQKFPLTAAQARYALDIIERYER